MRRTNHVFLTPAHTAKSPKKIFFNLEFIFHLTSSTSRHLRSSGRLSLKKVPKCRLPQGQVRRMADLHQEAWVKSLSVVTLCCVCSSVRLCARNFTHDVVCVTSPWTAWPVVYRLTCSWYSINFRAIRRSPAAISRKMKVFWGFREFVYFPVFG
jgi:hypothetical protein